MDCEPPVPYPLLITPSDVLDALALAYSRKDSVEFDLIYDDGYAGSSFDPKVPGELTFTKADEMRHIAALHRSLSIRNVSMTYPPARTRYTDLEDLPGWATIQLSGTGLNVEIADGENVYNLIGGGTFEFKFIPTTPDSTSPTDTTWKIVRWTEFQ